MKTKTTARLERLSIYRHRDKIIILSKGRIYARKPRPYNTLVFARVNVYRPCVIYISVVFWNYYVDGNGDDVKMISLLFSAVQKCARLAFLRVSFEITTCNNITYATRRVFTLIVPKIEISRSVRSAVINTVSSFYTISLYLSNDNFRAISCLKLKQNEIVWVLRHDLGMVDRYRDSRRSFWIEKRGIFPLIVSRSRNYY